MGVCTSVCGKDEFSEYNMKNLISDKGRPASLSKSDRSEVKHTTPCSHCSGLTRKMQTACPTMQVNPITRLTSITAPYTKVLHLETSLAIKLTQEGKRRECDTATVARNGPTAQVTKATGKMTKQTGTESSATQTETLTRETGSTTRHPDSAYTSIVRSTRNVSCIA